MASKNVEDFRTFDWDDTALIKAYNKGTKLREKVVQKGKDSKKGNSSKENMKDEKQWNVGDYCRAKYSEDKKMYEAKILSIKDSRCTVEFLGYGDQETVNLRDLKETGGKKSRRRQTNDALGGYSTPSESCMTNTDVESDSHRSMGFSKHSKGQHNLPFNYSAVENSFQMPQFPQVPAIPPQSAVNHSHAAACYAPAQPNMPFLPGPPAPPMPQCPGVAQNPSLSAMLVSWYMAGYYTGLHQGQGGSQCSQHCCSRTNRCCH